MAVRRGLTELRQCSERLTGTRPSSCTLKLSRRTHRGRRYRHPSAVSVSRGVPLVRRGAAGNSALETQACVVGGKAVLSFDGKRPRPVGTLAAIRMREWGPPRVAAPLSEPGPTSPPGAQTISGVHNSPGFPSPACPSSRGLWLRG